MSLRDTVMARADRGQLVRKSKPVPMPEWAGAGDSPVEVTVVEVSAAEWDAYQAESNRLKATRGSALVNFRARLVAIAARDADGNRLFGDEDAAQLGDLPRAEIDRLYEAAAKLNAMDGDGDEKSSEKNS